MDNILSKYSNILPNWLDNRARSRKKTILCSILLSLIFCHVGLAQASLTYSTSPDISTTSFSGNTFSISNEITTPHGISFDQIGSKLFVMGALNREVYQYSLSTNFDIATASFVASFYVAEDANPVDVTFNNDGTKMYIMGWNLDVVHEYALSPAYDVSSANHNTSYSVTLQETSASGVAFNTDGSKLFIIGSGSDAVAEYTLSTPFDVGTASYGGSFSVNAQDSSPGKLAFNPNGSKMYVTGGFGDSVYEYALSTPFDVSTSSFTQSFSVASVDDAPVGIALNNDGTSMFLSGQQYDQVYEYNLSNTAFTENPANDGTVNGSLIATMFGETFTNAGGTLTSPTHFNINNLPSGLTPILTVSGDGLTSTLTLSGNAIANQNVDDVADLNFSFTNAAFTGGNVLSVSNASNASSNLGLDFIGLVAYYPFDGDATDQSGNGNDLSEFNSPTLVNDRFGNAISAYSFDGSNDYMTSSLNLITNQPFSLSVWINWDGDNSSAREILSWLSSESSSRLYLGTSTSSELRFGDPYGSTGVTLTSGEWVQIGATYDGDVSRIYVNGELSATSSTGRQYDFTNSNLWVGRQGVNGGEYWDGLIDDIRIYNRALSASQISDLYVLESGIPVITSFSPTNGPIGTSVTITGTNFDTTPANNTVFFGATQATVTAALDTELTVNVPSGATYQPITVLVNELVAYSSEPFIVTFEGGGTIDANTFDPQVIFTTGTNPFSTALGDIDGDGKADLVVANSGSSSISVLRNTSSAGMVSFATNVDFPVSGTGPYVISIGDLDGDGKPDIATANNNSPTASVLRNTSTIGTIDASSFAATVDFATGTGPYAALIADMDVDGRSDLAVSISQPPDAVSVFRNIGTSGTIDASSFSSSVDFSLGDQPNRSAIGDLDGDGKPDFVSVNYQDNTMSVLRNTSTTGTIDANSFATQVTFATTSSPISVSIGDLDGDGKREIVVANQGSSSVSVYRNTSTNGTIDASSFSTKVDFITGTAPWDVSIGDLDGDGKVDLAVADLGSNTVSVLRNTSTSGVIDASSFATRVTYSTGTGPISVSIGDLDGDGRADMVVANNTAGSTVSVFRNTLDRLVAYFPLNGDATDQSGNGNDGTQSGGVDFTATDRFGNASSAASFDGTDDFITSSVNLTTNQPFTWSVWVNWDGTNGVYQNILSWWDNVQGQSPFLGTGNNSTEIRIGDTWNSTGINLQTNSWVQVVTTYDGSQSKLYLDGNLEATSGTGLNYDFTNGSLVIGNQNTFTEYWDGLIDDIRIYSRALTATEIFNLFTEGGWPNISSETDILSFAFLEQTATVTPDVVNHTIDIEVAYGTAVTGLTPTITPSLGATILPLSGAGQDFTNSVTYTVTAEDGSTTQDWTVTVTVAKNNASDITTFSFPQQSDVITPDVANHTVNIAVDFGTGLANLIADFTLSSGASATIAGTAQESGTTANAFLSAVTYRITAEDDVTIQDWVVTVTVAPPPSPIITAIQPTASIPGSEIIIYGVYFDPTPANNSVNIGGTAAAIISGSANSLKITVPNTILGPTDLVVNNGTSSTISAKNFTVLRPSLNVSFVSKSLVTTLADNAQSVFASDLDGDGDIDVLSASEDDNKIAWYENIDGTGLFGAQQIISTSALKAFSVYTSDLDGDGDLDVLSASWLDAKIAWYENTDGSGTFGPEQIITIEAAYAQSVYTADLDGDGDMDVLSASGTDDKVAWYENVDGLGNFSSQNVISTSMDYPTTVIAGDLDGDEDMDIISGSGMDGKVAWFENIDGQGTFGSIQLITDQLTNVWKVNTVDFDGDGDLDVLAASHLGNTITWYENTDSQGTFSIENVIHSNAASWESVASDMDGDGDMDVISALISSQKVLWHENTNSAGSFGNERIIDDQFSGATGVFTADLDGDGDMDVLACSQTSDEISWFENLSTPVTPGSDTDFILYTFPEATSTGTINNTDHRIDIEVIQSATLTDLVTTFDISTGASAYISGTFQTSGVTSNDFNTSPVIYNVIGQDGITNTDWSIYVTQATTLSSETDLILFDLPGAATSVQKNDVTFSYDVTIDIGTDVTNFAATFQASAGASVTVGGTQQESGVTQNNFSNSPTNYLVTAEDGTTIQNWEINVTEYSDFEDPAIAFSSAPPNTFPNATDIVSVDVSDNIGVTNVVFHWAGLRSINGTWESNNATESLTTVGQWTEELILSSFDELGMAFFFKVEDAAGNNAQTDTTIIYRAFDLSSAPNIPSAQLGSGGQAKDWRMFSVPYELDNSQISTLFETSLGTYDKAVWRLVRYNAGSDNFTEYKNGLSTIDLGKGYWFNSLDQASISLGPSQASSVTLTQLAKIPLDNGWTQIGNPYPFSINWNDVLAYNSSTAGRLKMFTGGTALSDASTLGAFEGAYVFSDDGTDMDVPFASNTGSRIKNAPGNLDNDWWELKINVTSGEFINRIGKIGMHPEANISKDAFDAMRVPRLAQYSDITFAHSEYFYPWFSGEVVPTNNSHLWEFDIESNTGVDTRLEWNNLQFGDNDFELYLVDDVSGNFVSMRARNHYDFSSSDIRSFKIYYGSKDSVFESISGGKPQLGLSYPNPFTDKTTIYFTLPVNEVKLNVAVAVYDAMGKIIHQIEMPTLGGGLHIVEWNSTENLTTGLYLIKLFVNGKTSKELSQRIIKQ